MYGAASTSACRVSFCIDSLVFVSLSPRFQSSSSFVVCGSFALMINSTYIGWSITWHAQQQIISYTAVWLKVKQELVPGHPILSSLPCPFLPPLLERLQFFIGYIRKNFLTWTIHSPTIYSPQLEEGNPFLLYLPVPSPFPAPSLPLAVGSPWNIYSWRIWVSAFSSQRGLGQSSSTA